MRKQTDINDDVRVLSFLLAEETLLLLVNYSRDYDRRPLSHGYRVVSYDNIELLTSYILLSLYWYNTIDNDVSKFAMLENSIKHTLDTSHDGDDRR